LARLETNFFLIDLSLTAKVDPKEKEWKVIEHLDLCKRNRKIQKDNKQEGEDEKFGPLMKITIVRILLALAAS
jgi:hypothetical protein